MKFSHLVILILALFLGVFIFKSLNAMAITPLYDFDEAHRAENAKRMRQYGSLIPLTGSAFDRVLDLKIPFKDNPDFYLYYHLERPGLIYWLMIISTQIFGDSEFAYRLPSFLLGLATMVVLIYFAKKFLQKDFLISLFVGLLVLLTSGDLWLSSQYAQLDTGLTVFLFLSLTCLIYYCQVKKWPFLLLAGISLAMSILSKGQQAVIFLFPLIFLLLTKRLTIKEGGKLLLTTLLILLPWLILVHIKFGLINFVKIFSQFAIFSATAQYLHHQAPIFWYVRWFWESFRPGWVVFLALTFLDIVSRRLDWRKQTLLSYIFGGLLFYSLAVNKIWWYVLPLLPVVAFYIVLSVKDFLKQKKPALFRLSAVLILASLPIFLKSSSTTAVIYGVLITATAIVLLKNNWLDKILNEKWQKWFFVLAIIFSLTVFYSQFPKIVPYHQHTKEVAQYFASLSGRKCLWILDMPVESALFYSSAGEIRPLNEGADLPTNCHNYLITPSSDTDKIKKMAPKNTLLLQKEEMKLYRLDI